MKVLGQVDTIPDLVEHAMPVNAPSVSALEPMDNNGEGDTHQAFVRLGAFLKREKKKSKSSKLSIGLQRYQECQEIAQITEDLQLDRRA